MKKSYFFKRKISATSKTCALLCVKALARFYKLTFAKRTVLFVTNEKIRSVNLGPIIQAGILLCIAFVINVFMNSLKYDKIISAKADEISKLKSANSFFEEEFIGVNEKLQKINEYFISITGSNSHNVKAIESDLELPKNFKEEHLNKQDKHTLNQVKGANFQISNIEAIAKVRIKKIEDAMAVTGLNIKRTPLQEMRKKSAGEPKEVSFKKSSSIGGQGGPLVEDRSLDSILSTYSTNTNSIERHLAKKRFVNEIDYLIALEQMVRVMPLARPMKNYYISSGFGHRTDPLTGGRASHQGIDFVGVEKEKIISPSEGRVILAGQFSDYGKAVVIDHGFGVTTRYGHLSEVKVKAGQTVKAGDVIALQGSTGRSTGPHLHYEVRYRNIPLNPRKFLEAGESLFDNEKSIKHANS